MLVLYVFLVGFIFVSLIWLLVTYGLRKRKYDDEKRYELLYKESLIVNDSVDLNNAEYKSYEEVKETDEEEAEQRIEDYLNRKKNTF